MALSIPATIKRHFDLEPGEAAVLWLMGAQIATLLGAYTIVKVLRDSMFISSYGALALPYGYVAVALASLGLLALDARFARRLSGTTVADVGQYVAIAASLAAALLKSRGADWLPAVFYVWAGSQAMLLLSHFWIGALDVWDSRRARVLFPVLSGFGLLGGIAGGAFASWGASRIHTQGLLWVLFGLLVVVRGWSFLLARRVPSKPLIAQAAASAPRWKAFAESSYLRHLAAAVGLAVLISTLVDFQFKFLAQKIYPTDAELARFLGGFYAGLQALALVVQFGFAGAVLRRVGLGPSSALQPASMFVFGVGLLLVPIWPIALAMRWAQGILFQTFGKPASEIYFLALRPPERRQVKPVLDVLVERGADALAGLLLVVTLRAMGVDVRIVGVLTALAAAVWIFVIYRLHRRYVAAFRASLSAPWAEPETASQALRVPGVVRALVEAIRSGDERQATIALRFSQRVGDRRLRDAVQESLGHESPRVRAEAVKALLGHRMSGEGETVSRFLEAPEEELRRAAVHYRLAFGPERERFAREALENDKLRDSALDIMAERPELAHGAVTLEWVDARIKRGSVQDLLDAARALVHVPGERGAERLRILLHHADPEVRRGALRAIALRPDASFLEEVTALLGDRDVGPDARNAMVAFGEAAVPRLARLASEGKTNTVRWLASMALARVRTKGARRVLLDLARSSDPVARYHGLRNLNRIGARIGRRLVSRPLALRMFLREIRELKTSVEPWRILRTASTTNAASGPALELLAASYRESADRALERSLRALGLHHDPRPFRAVYEALRTADSREATSRAMEYLAQMLPRKVFRVTQEVLDRWLRDEPEGEEPPDVEGVVRKAREADDAWLRACAVRAAHEHPEYDRALLRVREDDGPIVRDELRAGVALGGNGRRSDADRS